MLLDNSILIIRKVGELFQHDYSSGYILKIVIQLKKTFKIPYTSSCKSKWIKEISSFVNVSRFDKQWFGNDSQRRPSVVFTRQKPQESADGRLQTLWMGRELRSQSLGTWGVEWGEIVLLMRTVVRFGTIRPSIL